MFLSDIVDKNIYTGTTPRGTCLGVGVSLKSRAVKYLLCSSSLSKNTAFTSTDFSVNTTSVETIDEKVSISRLRPVFPKNCAKFFLGLPLYSSEGTFLGNVADLEMDNFVAIRLLTDRKEKYPISAIVACSDAVIVKKDMPYPLGQRIPAPILFKFDGKNDVVTKPILKEAIKKGILIRTTLSLPPFHFEFTEFSKKRRFFL